MFSDKIDRHRFIETERRREFREGIKTRLKESNQRLPSFGTYTQTGRIYCRICDGDFSDFTSFKQHVKERAHRERLEELKEELAVQKSVNDHIKKLMASSEEPGMNEVVSMTQQEIRKEGHLGKREPEGVLVLEERILEDEPDNDTNFKPHRNLLDYEDFGDDKVTNDQNIQLKPIHTGEIPVVNDIKLKSVSMVDALINEKEKMQENRTKSKLEQMKARVKEKAAKLQNK